MDADELKLVLARAFDRAWARYYRPGRVRMSPDIARPALDICKVCAMKIRKFGEFLLG